MQPTAFHNRVRELAVLRGLWDAPGAQLLVVWGRRRVGKTALLREATKNHRHLYLVGDSQRESVLLERFSQEVSRTIGPSGLSFLSWDALFEYLAEAAREPLIVILDEIGFLRESNPAFYSVLQRHWDTRLSSTRVRLVLCGSSVSVMERDVLGYRSPLYGRRTGQLEVLPVSYADARLFYPRSSEERRIEFYAVLGGIPAYLMQFDPSRTARENVEERVFRPVSYLYLEPRLLLLQELREPATYFSVLTAIAEGATRFNEISVRSGLAATKLGKYLGVLQSLRLVRRELPATERRVSVRRSLYRIADPFFDFWFRFVAPWTGSLEMGELDAPRQHFAVHWNNHVARIFECICRELVRSRPGVFGGPYASIGSWWQGENEIDVVALDRSRGAILAGECKWTSTRVGQEVLAGLKEKLDLIEGRWVERRLAIFSKSGFTENCRRAAGADAVLVDIPRLRAMMDGG